MRGNLTHVKQQTDRPLVPASFPLGNAWFVICCYAKQEADAKSDIESLGYEVWYPEERRIVIQRQRKVEILRPLFPGYIFVSFDREKHAWASINDLDGVFCVMTNGNLPMRVHDIVMEQLRRAQEAGAWDRTNPASNFKINELVEIAGDGPFAGLTARIKSATAKKRVKILLESLATITIDPVFLRKLGA